MIKHNYFFKNGNSTYECGCNEHSDKTHAEFKKDLCGAEKPSNVQSIPAPRFSKRQAVPASLDWRNYNGKVGVTSVKNQGGCGSCYTFNALAAIEGAYMVKYGKNLDLSEQQLVDCSHSHGNHGCDGGWMSSTFDYVKAAGGLALETAYPYTAKVATCQNKAKAGIITGWKQVAASELAIQQALASGAPIAAAIDANEKLQSYTKGVYDDATCTQKVNHAVTIVGYGRDSTSGKNFWVVKNSWGTTWGEQGYVRMVRDSRNQCALISYGYVPIV